MVDIVEVEAGDGDGPQLIIPAGCVLDGHAVVVGLIGQGNEACESVAEVLLSSQLVQVIDAVFERLDVAVEHGAGAAPPESVPGAMDVQVKRTEEIIESGVKKVAIACPFCMVMIQDGLNKTGHDKDIQVVDLAELVQKAMK